MCTVCIVVLSFLRNVYCGRKSWPQYNCQMNDKNINLESGHLFATSMASIGQTMRQSWRANSLNIFKFWTMWNTATKHYITSFLKQGVGSPLFTYSCHFHWHADFSSLTLFYTLSQLKKVSNMFVLYTYSTCLLSAAHSAYFPHPCVMPRLLYMILTQTHFARKKPNEL